MDITRAEVYTNPEAYISAGKIDAAKYKDKAFEFRADKADAAMKSAKTEAEFNKYRKIKEQSGRIHNKYGGKIYNGF